MSPAEEIKDRLENVNEGAVLLDGFDEALIGVSTQFNQPSVAVYSIGKMVEILMTGDQMTHDEAEEFLEFNTIQVHYADDGNPIFVE